jgi:hypothetical protein
MAVLVIGVVAVLVAAAFADLSTALGVGVGAAAAFGNLWLIGRIVGAFVSGAAKLPWALIAVLKFTVLYTGLYLLVKHEVVAIMPLAIGWGALPLGIVAGQFGAPGDEGEKGHVDA